MVENKPGISVNVTFAVILIDKLTYLALVTFGADYSGFTFALPGVQVTVVIQRSLGITLAI